MRRNCQKRGRKRTYRVVSWKEKEENVFKE
jgi:hypothetical protein